jgi:hypothetical protein
VKYADNGNRTNIFGPITATNEPSEQSFGIRCGCESKDWAAYGEVEIQLNILLNSVSDGGKCQLQAPDILSPICIWQDAGWVPELICTQ